MKNTFRARSRAAFTLVELVIAMALSLLVAGLVTSYIIFASGYNARGQAAYDRVEQITLLRREIDAWFSLADQQGYTIEITQDGTGELVSASSSSQADSQQASISYTSGMAVFRYPKNNDFARGNVSLSCSYLQGICFYIDNDSLQSSLTNEDDGIRFTIQTRFSEGGAVYACEFIYA